jgi:ABC-2 type transport system ATP-binding protein
MNNDELNTQVQDLPGGIKRILSILISLVGNPAIIILDEPSANLDLKSRLRVWKAIQQIREERTIVIATQIIEEAEILCERICLLKDGGILATGDTKEIKTNITSI